MKPAIAREYVFVERSKLALWPLVFLGVFCAATGFLIGDWSADSRFAEREQSIRQGLSQARAQADRIAESIRKGCYEYVDPRSGSSRFMKGM